MKHLPLIITIVLLLIVSGAFALREMGCTLRADRLNMELSSVVPPLVWLITDYTASHREDGAWPPPGTVYDDSMMQFLSSRVEGTDRIDTYDTPIDGRRIDFVLSSDGTIRAWVRTEHR